jgi:hypothetical protein
VDQARRPPQELYSTASTLFPGIRIAENPSQDMVPEIRTQMTLNYVTERENGV